MKRNNAGRKTAVILTTTLSLLLAIGIFIIGWGNASAAPDDNSNITINNAATTGIVTSGTNPITYSPNADNANINAADIIAQLNVGNSVIINTTNGTGTEVGQITIAANVTQSDVDMDADLTLQANGDIIQNSGIGVTLYDGGNLNYTAARQINLNTSATVTAQNGDITMTANSGGGMAGDFVGIYLTTAAIATNSGSGSITLNGTAGSGAFVQKYGVHLNGGRLYTASGDLTINGTAQATGATNVGVRLDANATTGAVVQATTGNVEHYRHWHRDRLPWYFCLAIPRDGGCYNIVYRRQYCPRRQWLKLLRR